MKVSINKIKKISVNKSDEVALVVEKIIDADAKEVILSIPRFSKLAESLANFHLIKREASLLKKKIIVESVDDKVIDLAGVSGLDSWNPILSRTKRQFSDIVSTRQTKADQDEDEILKNKLVESVNRKPAKLKRRVNLKRRALYLAAGLVFFGGAFFIANSVLPKAEIQLTTVKSDWTYTDSVVAQKLASIDSRNATVPGQIFTEKQTIQLSYPASGKKSVAEKATGPVTIYNAYSSDPQPLVATTRLLTPDGKIFRLSKGVTVPGAKIVEGNIIPSTLVADVVADQAGIEYNLGPVSHFTIPGFKGTPKYSAFYANSQAVMTGGYIGLVAYPTDSDLAKAKADISAKIQASIKQKITVQVPSDFKLVDGASKFTLIKHNIITVPNSDGTFQISSDAQISVIAFREADVLKMLTGKLEKDKGLDYELKSSTVTYGAGRADFSIGKISFPVNFKAVIAKRVDIQELRQQIKGKSEAELRRIVYGLPSIQTIQIGLWPFWVKSVPQNEAKISITVD